MKKTEITIETHQVKVIRRSRRAERAWCAACGAMVQMVTAEQSALLAGVTTRAIYRWVEEGRLHFTETEAGGLLVCPGSLN